MCNNLIVFIVNYFQNKIMCFNRLALFLIYLFEMEIQAYSEVFFHKIGLLETSNPSKTFHFQFIPSGLFLSLI